MEKHRSKWQNKNNQEKVIRKAMLLRISMLNSMIKMRVMTKITRVVVVTMTMMKTMMRMMIKSTEIQTNKPQIKIRGKRKRNESIIDNLK